MRLETNPIHINGHLKQGTQSYISTVDFNSFLTSCICQFVTQMNENKQIFETIEYNVQTSYILIPLTENRSFIHFGLNTLGIHILNTEKVYPFIYFEVRKRGPFRTHIVPTHLMEVPPPPRSYTAYMYILINILNNQN